MRDRNIRLLSETLQILEHKAYRKGQDIFSLKLSDEEMTDCRVLLPEDVERICSDGNFRVPVSRENKCVYSCVNMGSLSAARQLYKSPEYLLEKDPKPVLVLNLANPVQPGGGVHKGARAQEEDLCRKSSLLRSLESAQAKKYYNYNLGLSSYMGSDSMIFTPKVEVIRNDKGELLDETVIVSVLTCAAPMVSMGKEGLSEAEYEEMFYHRIVSVLKCAAYFGYRYLVLGAWGCGAFGNDARLVSDLFSKALKELDYNHIRERDLFRRIVFAVWDRTSGQYNFREFCRNFDMKRS